MVNNGLASGAEGFVLHSEGARVADAMIKAEMASHQEAGALNRHVSYRRYWLTHHLYRRGKDGSSCSVCAARLLSLHARDKYGLLLAYQ